VIPTLVVAPLPGDTLEVILAITREFTAALHPDTTHVEIRRTPYAVIADHKQRAFRWSWRGADGARCWAQVIPGVEGIHPYYVIEPESPDQGPWFTLRSEPLFKRYDPDNAEAGREDIRLMDWATSQAMTILAGDRDANRFISLEMMEEGT
jgi:hypothetical protein